MPLRLDELKAVFEFQPEDESALQALYEVARPHLDELSEQFYARLETDAATRELAGGRARGGHLRQTMVDWMSSSLAGPHDEGYFADRVRIGQMHVRAGLPQAYILASMNFIRAGFHSLAETLVIVPGESPRTIHGAIDRLLDLELAILLESYQDDADARLRESERNRLVTELQATGALRTGLADELRNPLNAACLQLRVLGARLSRGEAEPSVREPLELAQADVERLARLVDDVLALAEPQRPGVRASNGSANDP